MNHKAGSQRDMAVSAMRVMGVSPMVSRDHGRDGRGTHGRDARVTTMKRIATLLLLVLIAGQASAQELSLVEVKPFCADCISATGRVQAPLSAKVGARVSGVLAEFAKDDKGNMLDAGSVVKAGDVLFKLNETTFHNAVAVNEAAVKTAQANLDNLQAPPRTEKVEQLREAIGELDVRIADRQREEERYRRLVEVDKTQPVKRLEEVQTDLAVLRTLRRAAQSRLDEANNGPTATEIAVARAHVEQAQASLKAAQDDLRDSAIKAPFGGLVTRRYKSPGDYIANVPPTEVVELMANDQLEAELHLPEAYLRAVQVGKTVIVIRSPLMAGEIKTTLARVIENVDPASGTFTVKVIIPDGKTGLAPGAFVTAEVRIDSPTAQVLVPLRAIVAEGGQNYVFVAQNGKMSRRAVEMGERLTELAVIKGGLESGSKIVMGPPEKLKDGADVPEYLMKKQ